MIYVMGNVNQVQGCAAIRRLDCKLRLTNVALTIGGSLKKHILQRELHMIIIVNS